MVWAVAALIALGMCGAGVAAAATTPKEYVVLYDTDARASAARAAIREAGGRVIRENDAVGLATIRTKSRNFRAAVSGAGAIDGVAANRAIGRAPADRLKRDLTDLDADADAGRARPMRSPLNPAMDPFSTVQWDMAMIDADFTGSYRYEQGSHDVLVGVIDTGIEANHPDIAPNFNRELSRNFTVDDPVVDGPCEEDPDQSCEDPADVDEGGHGTHVAGTIGAPLNQIGIGGVAPRVGLVNLRAGQDSGFFFLQPTVDALTFAGNHGIDVVNMSFFTDPWLYNCTSNPADSLAEQAQQRTVIAATQRALRFARRHGVTLLSALGNESTDLGNPTEDLISPDYPPGSERTRTVDNSCLTMPTEGEGVVGVSAVGPSGRKAWYSNYGVEQNDVSAPGGDALDFPGTSAYSQPENRILSPTSEVSLVERGFLDPADPSNRVRSEVVDGRPGTGSTTTARRWPRRTRPASPRSSCRAGKARRRPRREHTEATGGRAAACANRAGRSLPGAADLRLSAGPRTGDTGVAGDVRGIAGLQWVLWPRHRQRAPGGHAPLSAGAVGVGF